MHKDHKNQQNLQKKKEVKFYGLTYARMLPKNCCDTAPSIKTILLQYFFQMFARSLYLTTPFSFFVIEKLFPVFFSLLSYISILVQKFLSLGLIRT